MTRASVVDRLFRHAPPAMAYRRACRLTERGQHAQAFRLFARAAHAGMAPAEYQVGRSYLEGTVVPRSRGEAVRWLSRAGEGGSTEAQSLLAALYLNGQLVGPDTSSAAGREGLFAGIRREPDGRPNFAEAALWARRAAEKGSAEGQALWAYILVSGPTELRDPTASRSWYERSAKGGSSQGHLGLALALAPSARSVGEWGRVVGHLRSAADAGLTTAIYLLAVLNERGTGLPKDDGEALRLYRSAAEKGHGPSQACLGHRLLGRAASRDDIVEGEHWLRRSAIAGNADAAVRLGDLYASAADGKQDFVEAATWFRRAAEAGHTRAARALGSLYATGAGVAQDHEEAARWFGLSVKRGDAAAATDLGNLVIKGLVETEGHDQLRQVFLQASSAGDFVATYNLAVALAAGVGGERDEVGAAQLMRRAAAQLPEAKYRFGRMLAEGRGVQADLAEARSWLAQAADAGMPDAQALLGEMMINGRGGPGDPAAARRLFEAAAAQGHAGAMYALGALHSGTYSASPDLATAFKWFLSAAEKNHGSGQLMAGRYYANGIAVDRDLGMARQWLERAAAQGLAEALKDLQALPAEE